MREIADGAVVLDDCAVVDDDTGPQPRAFVHDSPRQNNCTWPR